MGLNVSTKVCDGDKIRNKQIILHLSGDARTILCVERTMLNLISRMSGIATLTRAIVEKLHLANLPVKIAATRKTALGLLYFDKKAIIVGGADSHRLHLDDLVLIKDNHLAIAGGVKKAVSQAKLKASFSKKIEVEVTSIEDALIAAKEGADIIMLDNFSPDETKNACKTLRKAGFDKILIEASGGINSANFLEYAGAQVNIISMGELTQNVKSLNISLEVTSKK
jgi:nicotinate-nucleotide pyrophosphorylase (carboxylating)